MTARFPEPGLDNTISLTLKAACRATGWSKNKMYDEIGAGKVETYLLGFRRYVFTTSLRDRVEELRAVSPPVRPVANLKRKDGPEREPGPRRGRKRPLPKGPEEEGDGGRIRRPPT